MGRTARQSGNAWCSLSQAAKSSLCLPNNLLGAVSLVLQFQTYLVLVLAIAGYLCS